MTVQVLVHVLSFTSWICGPLQQSRLWIAWSLSRASFLPQHDLWGVHWAEHPPAPGDEQHWIQLHQQACSLYMNTTIWPLTVLHPPSGTLMHGPIFDCTCSVLERLATGYATDGSPEPVYDVGWWGPAGQMYSTLQDLNKVCFSHAASILFFKFIITFFVPFFVVCKIFLFCWWYSENWGASEARGIIPHIEETHDSTQ